MKSADVLARLRDLGFDVRVTHLRILEGGTLAPMRVAKIGGLRIEPHGGETRVEILSAAGETAVSRILATGEARCSKRDNFCKRMGMQIALGRALKNLEAAVGSFGPKRCIGD